jgi:hypothetical protein
LHAKKLFINQKAVLFIKCENVFIDQIDAILDAIFGNTGASREEFDKWLAAYQAGKKLVTRDFELDQNGGAVFGGYTKPNMTRLVTRDFVITIISEP